MKVIKVLSILNVCYFLLLLISVEIDAEMVSPEEIQPIKALFLVHQIQSPVFQDKEFNIKDNGAVDGGQVSNKPT